MGDFLTLDFFILNYLNAFKFNLLVYDIIGRICLEALEQSASVYKQIRC